MMGENQFEASRFPNDQRAHQFEQQGVRLPSPSLDGPARPLVPIDRGSRRTGLSGIAGPGGLDRQDVLAPTDGQLGEKKMRFPDAAAHCQLLIDQTFREGIESQGAVAPRRQMVGHRVGLFGGRLAEGRDDPIRVDGERAAIPGGHRSR